MLPMQRRSETNRLPEGIFFGIKAVSLLLESLKAVVLKTGDNPPCEQLFLKNCEIICG